VPGFMCGRDLADTIAGSGPEPLFPADRVYQERAARRSLADASAGRVTSP
jgi:hypothetical protein